MILFSGISGNPYQATISTVLKQGWANILSGAAVMERPDFIIEKKHSSL